MNPNFPHISPFKLLQSYTREDSRHFFGREKETRLLSEMLMHSKLVLLYGPSGSGKTSLIQCGLGGMLSPRDWLPIFVRRGQGFEQSIRLSLLKKCRELQAFEQSARNTSELEQLSIRELVQQVFRISRLPVYLILDQFEELFILGDKTEQDDFFQNLEDLQLFSEDFFCKILISTREEYLANFYDYESSLPYLFENRFRVERMRSQQVLQVVEGMLKVPYAGYPNFQLEQGVALDIREKLENKQHQVELTDLQIYLDRLYRKAVDAASPDDQEVFFSKALVAANPLDNVLSQFLDEQLAKIKLDYKAKNSTEQPVLKLLYPFVSEQGTKQSQDLKTVLENLQLAKTPFSEQQVASVLEQLCAPDVRLLKRLDLEEGQPSRYELWHDRLAAQVFARFSTEELQRRQALSQLDSVLKLNQDQEGGKKTYLSIRALELVDENLDQSGLKAEQVELINQSKATHRRARNLRWTAYATVLTLTLTAAFFFWLNGQNQRLNAEVNALVAEARRIEKDDPVAARKIINQALRLSPNSKVAIQARKDLWESQQFYYRKLKMRGNVYCIDASEDGQEIVVGVDSSVCLLDGEGRVRQEVKLAAEIRALHYVKEKRAYVLDSYGQIWEIDLYKESKYRIDSLQDWAFGIAYHDRTKILAVMDMYGRLHTYLHSRKQTSLTIVEMEAPFIPTTYPAHTLDFNANGDKLVSVIDSGRAMVFDLTGRVWRRVKLGRDVILSVEFHPQKDEVLSLSRDGQAHLWDANRIVSGVQEKSLPTFSLSANADRINFGQFNKRGNAVLLGAQNRKLYVWGTERGDLVSYLGHQNGIIGGKWLFEGRQFISIDQDSSLLWWKTASKAKQVFGPHINEVEKLIVAKSGLIFSADGTGGKMSYTAQNDLSSTIKSQYQAVIKVWNPQKSRLVQQKAALQGGIRDIALLEDKHTIVAIGTGMELFFWNTKTGFSFKKTVGSEYVYHLCKIKQGQFAISTLDDIQIWNYQGELLSSIPYPSPNDRPNCLSWNEKEQALYASLDYSGLCKYQNQKWTLIKDAPKNILSMSWTVDSGKLALGSQISEEGEIGSYLWNTLDKVFVPLRLSLSDRGGISKCFDLDFSPDGRYLGIAIGSKAIVVDVNTLQEVQAMGDKPTTGVYAVRFSKSGNEIYMGTGDGYVFVYSIPK